MEIKGSGAAKPRKRSTFSILYKMAVRETKKSWAQFLAIVAIGAIAVTLFIGLLSNAECFDRQLNATYDAGNMADVWVYSLRYQDSDAAYVNSRLEDGDDIDGRFEYTATANGQGVYLNVYQSYPSISVPYDVVYAEGYGPEDTVDYAFVDHNLLASEDSVEVTVTTNSISEGNHELTATGDPSVTDGTFELTQNQVWEGKVTVNFTASTTDVEITLELI